MQTRGATIGAKPYDREMLSLRPDRVNAGWPKKKAAPELALRRRCFRFEEARSASRHALRHGRSHRLDNLAHLVGDVLTAELVGHRVGHLLGHLGALFHRLLGGAAEILLLGPAPRQAG